MSISYQSLHRIFLNLAMDNILWLLKPISILPHLPISIIVFVCDSKNWFYAIICFYTFEKFRQGNFSFSDNRIINIFIINVLRIKKLFLHHDFAILYQLVFPDDVVLSRSVLRTYSGPEPEFLINRFAYQTNWLVC